MLWAVQPDRPISVPEGQHHPFHPIDAAAIKGLRSAKSADKYSLFAFSRWLVANGRPALAPRLRDPSLEEDLKEYASTDSSSHVAGALCNLKKSIAGISLEHWLKTLLPPSDDAKLIEKYRAVSIHAGLRPKTVALFAGALTRFSKFLHQTDKKGIADRIDDRSLDCDVESYKTLVPEREAKNINQALVHLRRLASGGEIAPPEYAVARRVGDVREAAAAARPRQLDSPATARLQDAYRYVAVVDVTTPSLLLVDRGPQPASSQELPSTPPRLSGEDWDMLWELRQEPPLWPQPGLGLGPQSSSFHAFAPMPSQSAEDGSRYGEQIREPAPYPLMKLGRHRNLNG
ncbi:hypothetical protein [Rhizobium leguminosarum]|uniref:hypothetical protein n=1 Tax=Rhizobium leguminosarum TaxID=384 RepID=UPI0013BBBCD4|nr:hypothetical protein [Rhizobium leguminosarum]NEI67753.1 hypothetical protein [Rhizobium leguminosarum]